jgi:DNA-binding CsgD family transcriptional regulator
VIAEAQYVTLIVPRMMIRIPVRTAKRVTDAPPGLTKRESQVFDSLLSGRSGKEIAGDLDISLRTVKSHIRGIYKKGVVRTRAELQAKYGAL